MRSLFSTTFVPYGAHTLSDVVVGWSWRRYHPSQVAGIIHLRTGQVQHLAAFEAIPAHEEVSRCANIV